MRGGNALFLIIWMHGPKREGGAPVQKINHISAFCFPVSPSSALFRELASRAFAHELLYMASSKGGWLFFGERARHGEMEKPDLKSEVKAIYS